MTKRAVSSQQRSCEKRAPCHGMFDICVSSLALGVLACDSCEYFDPRIAQWVPVQSMLSWRSGAAVAVYRAQNYACGGCDGEHYFRSCEYLHPFRNASERFAPMMQRRAYACAALLGIDLRVFGVYDGARIHKSVESRMHQLEH